jgi:hypothetical protein
MMKNNDNSNEAIGIVSIIIIIILAGIGLYFFFSHRPLSALNAEEYPNVPLEAPVPNNMNDNGSNQ